MSDVDVNLIKEKVIAAIRTCYDPEIPVNIVDLGLVYGVELQGGNINVTMTLTAPGCQMGAMITQHPDLFRAIVSSVGIYDMLRVELAPNGAFNVTEFGTVKNPEQFKALYAYSPYHHVVDGTKYPAVLMMTGANDGRVAPYHSRKMTARLVTANKSENPILLRTSSSAGHGIGTALSERIKQLADIYAFLFAQLGMAGKPGD